MLKIEKNEKVEIQLVKREIFFSKQMIIALSCAFIFHLTGIIFIQVKPLMHNQSDYIFPTVAVNAEIEKPSAAIAAINSDGPSKKQIPIPPRTLPEAPKTPEVNIYAHIDPFDLTEYSPLQIPEFSVGMDVPQTIEDKEITIRLCGAASNLVLLETGIPTEFPEIPEGNFIAKFSVRIDPESGSVVWHHPLNESILSQLGKKILQNIKTAQECDKCFLIPGEVEIIAHNQKL